MQQRPSAPGRPASVRAPVQTRFARPVTTRKTSGYGRANACLALYCATLMAMVRRFMSIRPVNLGTVSDDDVIRREGPRHRAGRGNADAFHCGDRPTYIPADGDDLPANVRVYPAVGADREGGLSDVNAPFDTPLDEQIVVAANLAHDVHARSNTGHVLSTEGPPYRPVAG